MARGTISETERRAKPLGLWSATALVIANMIGAGVFTTSGLLLADLGSRAWTLAAWGLGGVIAGLGAMCYGALGRRLPQSGGEYLFLSKTIHPLAGYLAGWVSFLAGFSAPLAAVAVAFGAYGSSMTPAPPMALASAVIILAAALHSAGVRQGAWVQNSIVAVKLAVIGIFLGLGFGHWDAGPVAAGPNELRASAFAGALLMVWFGYSGWNAAVYVAGEIRSPEKNLPRAMWLGTGVVTLIYLALNAVFLFAAPASAIAGEVTIAMIAAESIGGPRLGQLMGGLICLALISSASSLTMAGPRVYERMARDGCAPGWLKAMSGAPRAAIWLQAAVALLLAWTATFGALLTYIGFTLSLSAAGTVIGLIRLRRREGEAMWAPGWPWAPWIFVTLVLGAAALSIAQNPVDCFVGLLTLLIPTILWFLQRKWRNGADRESSEP